ncbi:hypothetical protein YC2023_022973 [Brassica napus]
METSRHGAVKENHYLDDAAYIVVKIMIEMVRMRLAGSNECIDSLIKDLEEPLEALGLRMNILSEPRDAIEKGIEAIATFSQYIEEGKLKGWELDSCGECWVIEGCIVDSNDHQSAIDAHMYRCVLSGKVKSTLGYTALKFACRTVKITEKCDVYGFGILVLEVVTGKRPVEYAEDDVMVLSETVREGLEEGRVEEFVDGRLRANFPAEEAIPVLKLGLVCGS